LVKGDSGSAVSRRLTAATAPQFAEMLGRRLDGLDVAVMMIDGIGSADYCEVVALAINFDRHQSVAALRRATLGARPAPPICSQ
jgi:hypothetical protein